MRAVSGSTGSGASGTALPVGPGLAGRAARRPPLAESIGSSQSLLLKAVLLQQTAQIPRSLRKLFRIPHRFRATQTRPGHRRSFPRRRLIRRERGGHMPRLPQAFRADQIIHTRRRFGQGAGSGQRKLGRPQRHSQLVQIHDGVGVTASVPERKRSCIWRGHGANLPSRTAPGLGVFSTPLARCRAILQ